MKENKGLEITYRAETESDLNNLAESLLMVRSITLMSKKFVETRLELEEGYHDLATSFDTIKMLIEPALTFLCYDAIDHLKAFNEKKGGENEN